MRYFALRQEMLRRAHATKLAKPGKSVKNDPAQRTAPLSRVLVNRSRIWGALATGCDNETLAEKANNLYSERPQRENVEPRGGNARRERATRNEKMQYRQVFEDAIYKLKNEKRYRVFADIERDAERFPSRAVARRQRKSARHHHLVLQRLSRHGRPPGSDRGDEERRLPARRRRRRHPQYFRHQSSAGPARSRTRRPARQGAALCSSPRAGFPISRRSRPSPTSCPIA